MQIVSLDQNLKDFIDKKPSEEYMRVKSKMEGFPEQNEFFANSAQNNLSEGQENIQTQNDINFIKNSNFKNLFSSTQDKYICFELDGDYLVIFEILSENQHLATVKIVN
jgi:hypothetical protein